MIDSNDGNPQRQLTCAYKLKVRLGMLIASLILSSICTLTVVKANAQEQEARIMQVQPVELATYEKVTKAKVPQVKRPQFRARLLRQWWPIQPVRYRIYRHQLVD